MNRGIKLKIIEILLYLGYFILGCVFTNFLFLEKWVFRTWQRLTLDELIYHFRTSLDGTNNDVIIDCLVKSILPAFVLWVFFFVLVIIVGKKHVFIKRIIILSSFVLCLLLFAISCYKAEQKIGILTYSKQVFSGNNSDFIEANYENPVDVDIAFPSQKQNLIYIYIESMEMTFADKKSGGAFDDNMIKELTQIAIENEDFSGNKDKLNGCVCLPGTTWTMGAMFGQTSGVPLKISLNGNQMENQDSFFSDMITLGDILEEEGYCQELLIGSDATFGGRRTYFTEHGDYKIHDYNYASDNGLIPHGYCVFWGLEDEKLFDFAKKDIMELANGSEPFNLSILTVDTHFEDGYVCELCGSEYADNQYANVIACSSRQISDFVEWVKKQFFFENTTIVLCGDHITMDSDFCNSIDKNYLRKTYLAIINGRAEIENDYGAREFSTLDMFPTTLASMGVNISGNKLGLGVNLYSNEKTLIEKYGLDFCTKELSKPSFFIDEYSDTEIDGVLMNKIATNCDVVVNESEDNTACFRIDSYTIDKLVNADAIKKVSIVILNADDIKQYSYDMEVIRSETDPNSFACEVKTDIPVGRLSNMHAKVYIDIGDYSDYLIDDWQYSEIK